MQASQLISEAIPSLQSTDTVQRALDLMTEFKISHLPLVNNHQYIGLVSVDDLLMVKDHFRLLSELDLILLPVFAYDDAHVLEAAKLLIQQQVSVLPVLALDKNYLGLITQQHLLQMLFQQLSLDSSGAVIVLSISKRDLSVAQIAQIVESNHAHMLHCYTTSYAQSTNVDITIKVDITDIAALRSDFERYEYDIKAIYNHHDLDQHMIDRYEALMKYLSI